MLKPNYIYQFFRYLKLLLALFILIIFSNIAYSDVYKVENLIIEKQHKNDKNFKNRVIKQAIQSSFVIFLERILLKKEYWKIENIEMSEVNKLISNFSILEEKKINNKYKLIYSISFDKKKIKKFLNNKNIIYTDTISSPILILPIIKSEKNVIIWQDNFILKNWDSSNYKNYLVNYIIPTGDLEDQQSIDKINININNFNSINLLKKYGLKNSLVILIDLNSNINNVNYKLTINNTNFYKKFNVQFPKKNFINVIDLIKLETEKIWKNKNTIFSGSVLSLEFKTNIENLKRLNKLRLKISQIENIQKIKDLSISSTIYTGKIYYTGTINSLVRNFKESNLDLKENLKFWSIVNNE